ncbi:leucocin A/sakacin P family class II bacteriocin [Enterococcus faecium]|uniref:Enterocin-HF n=1 Tax=Enterococcus faecium TaxID=1352 RepID=ETCHF_ENTFC|nr:leucocin A/sakacin P family class II bacteriocin [Enterococcus faecium]P86183.2 RecName: Full=Enterocin-HF; Flags: Precursor [Enterococcus faecium]AHW46186.1 enterocin HF [Enterococcus faecium]
MEKLTVKEMSQVVGGKYYGNGVSCNKKGCSVDWGKAIGIIGNNAAANLTTGGKAGWKG